MKFRFNIYAWGHGGCGQLGLGDKSNRHVPTLLNTCKEWTQIVAGGYWHRAALTKEGKVFTWGYNYCGRLGHGDRQDKHIPTKVESLDGLVIVKIACGQYHTIAITDDGDAYTWGCGKDGCLGHGNGRLGHDECTPKKVEALAGEVIVDVACGARHTLAVTSTGSIYTWGDDGYGDNFLPTLLPDLSSKVVISVSAGEDSTACVTKAGDVFTWSNGRYGDGRYGDGRYGRLGHGDESNQKTPKRVEALIGVKAKQVSCGCDHTAVCTEDGRVYTFGKGEQLGHGDETNRTIPTLVKALEGKHITQVQCGYSHTMALTSSGYVFTWGDADYGRLGHDSIKSKLKYLTIPCLVEGLREHNVVQITSAAYNCAVIVDSQPSTIRQSQLASFNNKEHSDVVFMVENEPIYANIELLSQQSDYFAAMFRHNMRENIERVVTIPDCSNAILLQVLRYVCMDGFSVSIDDVVELWVLADMYQMEGLKLCCLGLLEKDLCEKNDASRILEEVEDLSCPCDELKRICLEVLERI